MAENVGGISEQKYINEEGGNNIECIDNDPNNVKYDGERDLKRYSRDDLLSLRNDQLSIHHPECALQSHLQALSIWTCRLRCELQYLGLWKVPNNGNPYGNCGNNPNCCQSSSCIDDQPYASSGYGNVLGISGCYGNNVQQTLMTTGSSPTMDNKRAVRSRERFLNHQRSINTELIRATSPGEMGLHPTNYQNLKVAFVDHRSISSSHLMPAFAKRRLGNVNSVHNLSDGGTLSNNGNKPDNLENECNRDRESPNHLDTSTSLKASRKATLKPGVCQNDQYAYKTSTQNSRNDKNDQLDNKSGRINLVQKMNSDYSPPSNNKNNSGMNNKKFIYERRIGSGRLVPRDVNWEMRAGGGNSKQVDKNTPNSNTGDKDNSGLGVENLNQRNSTPRYSDSRPQERRPYDRRISNSDDTNTEKHEANISNVGSGNKRHSTNHGDDRNNLDPNNSNHFQQNQQQFVGQRSMSFRRREYSEHHREHRDYRDFREQRDFREHREHREQKDQKHHKEEPEWFSEGPTSQHDTIELRGFEENDDKELDLTKTERKVTDSNSLFRHNSDANLSNNKNSNSDISIIEQVSSSSNKNLLEEVENDNSCIRSNDKQNEEIIDDNVENDGDFVKINNENAENMDKCESSNLAELFFDNLLNMESLESTLIADQDQALTSNDCSGGISRFSRWFSNNSNNEICSNNDELNLPIVDELESSSKDENNCSESNSFMTFLRRNNFPTPELPKSLPQNVSAVSVEELEARMRKMDKIDRITCESANDGPSKISESTDSVSQRTDIPSQDVEAFKKLLDQLGKPQVDISMNIILPHSGHPVSLGTPVGVLPPGIISNTLPQSNMLKPEHTLNIMNQQQQQQLLHQQQQQNFIKVGPAHQHHRLSQLSPHQQQQQQQGGGVNENMSTMAAPPHLSSLLINHPQKRLDVQNLIQSLARGEVSLNLLEHELNKLNIPTQKRLDVQHLIQSLARGEVSLNFLEHELNKLNVPTQRELQIHTQAIMQNALLKKKLEVEQHEAIRRRQEMHKQLELEASNQQPVSRHMNSPTPLAFTPTSVLRKMTAEKDSSQQTSTAMISPQLNQHLKLTPQQIHNQQLTYQHVNQPRMILGGGSHVNQQQQQQQHQVTSTNSGPQISPQQKAQIRNQPPAPIKWSSVPQSSLNTTHPLMNSIINKPMGRPILKGPIPTTAQHPQNQHQQYSNQSNNIQPAQTLTQRQKFSTQSQPRQIVGQQFPPHVLSHQVNTSHQNNMQQQPQLFQQQHRSTAIHCQQIQQHTDAGNHTNIPSVHHPANNDNTSVRNINYQRDGGLSPTSNQLAQWFSPELLAQASAGKLPLLNVNQALSLEEFERSIQHSSTAEHN